MRCALLTCMLVAFTRAVLLMCALLLRKPEVGGLYLLHEGQ